MKKKIYITKKRDKELNIALSIDDYMHEKWIRMMSEVKKEQGKLIRCPVKIERVLRKMGPNVYENMQIQDVIHTPEGLRVIV